MGVQPHTGKTAFQGGFLKPWDMIPRKHMQLDSWRNSADGVRSISLGRSGGVLCGRQGTPGPRRMVWGLGLDAEY